MLTHHPDSDTHRGLLRIAIDTGADTGEGDALGALLQGAFEGIPVAIFQELGFAQCTAAPYGARGVDDPARLETEPGGDLGFAGGAPAELTTGFQQFRPRGPMDGPIHPATAQQ